MSGSPSAPLSGLKVLDLTRILAGPTCTQLFGDLGADVVKVERPELGDDTRRWGPPYMPGPDGDSEGLSAYFICANRSKRSLAVDVANPEGQALIRRLAAEADVMIENFKAGGLAKYGLAYDDLKGACPRLVYCSITGFGQTGPYAPRAGYDFLAQGMGGIMSVTGAPEGEPMKVGVGIADVMCGFYASTAVLSALRLRDRTGRGQHIDLALLDTQIAWLINEATNYFVSGQVPIRRGNDHPNIVPYTVLPASDGHFILAAGNDGQYRRFCEFAGEPDLADDPRFRTTSNRVRNRDPLYERLRAITVGKTVDQWIEGLAERGVPAGPVNSLDSVFEDPQVIHRGMRRTMDFPHTPSGKLEVLGNPIHFSESEIAMDRPPPLVGEHTAEVLSDWLGLGEEEIDGLAEAGAVQPFNGSGTRKKTLD